MASAKPPPKGPLPKVNEDEDNVHWVVVALICAVLLVAAFGTLMSGAARLSVSDESRKAAPCE